ncbi:MAG: TlpA family protein disulfide reductase [Candidatus Binataceae bacterium]
MGRSAKILSGTAVVILLLALALIIYVQWPGRGGNPAPDIALASQPGLTRADTPPVPAGKMAPGFTLKDMQGHTVSLSSLRGKVVFLNIWATWCPPCREEMPSIESLYKEFHNDHDFVILAVSQDTDGAQAVAPYLKSNGFNFTVLLDPKNVVGEAYNVSGIPETFIIDQQGRIVAHHIGPYDWSNSEIRDALQELVSSKTG